MVIKPAIVTMMREALPKFSLASTPGVLYIFRRSVPGEPYDIVQFQRDGHSGALAVQVATTYNVEWRGASARPLGRSTGLADLRYRWKFWVNYAGLPVMLNWYMYDKSPERLARQLREIAHYLRRYALPFFRQSRAQLLSDPLLQRAIAVIRELGGLADDEREQLGTHLQSAGYLLPNLTNSRYLQIRKSLEQFADEIGAKDRDRRMIPRLAYDLLAMYPDYFPSIAPGPPDDGAPPR